MVRGLEEEKEQLKSRFNHFRGKHSTSSMNAASAAAAVSPPPPSRQDIIVQNINKDMELMKEKFSKLLLGEDMSGGGKGVSSALALSNAITNLAASAFGEEKRLEPLAPETRARWKKEMDWLLSVTDYIVEMVPIKQISKDGTTMEVMTTRQRADLHANIPALRKLDAMLIDCLDNFKDQNEVANVSDSPNGLSESTRKRLLFQKDSVNQVLKAAMAINAYVLSQMEIPETYVDSLPKNGRSSLGDSVYKSIMVDHFDADHFLLSTDLSSEHKILDLKNKIEACIVIWKRKMNDAKDGKSAWSSTVTLEKRELLEDRAETILLVMKQRFPGIPQSALDISKIQHNTVQNKTQLNQINLKCLCLSSGLSLNWVGLQDIGHSILESYSRIIESLAFAVVSRINDVIKANSLDRNHSTTGEGTPKSLRLLDFIDSTDDSPKFTTKPANIDTNRRFSYAENLGILRSPTARH
ncbi:rop guanine nucleotide exchange factor 12-like [Impatiens glandulifera]|uniref:rop guanine nucleotide exchange factor 12-like n=1 Tax=Impatiens glandulifera TaxID=253017 RepID=UPI001FB07D40|nr:rop guanine nucleotide exchange factor 12-like [Impatiens glandulifera]